MNVFQSVLQAIHASHVELKQILGQNLAGLTQGFDYRPDRPNRRGPVPVYRSGLVGNRSVPVEFKFEFKFRSSTGSYHYISRFDRFIGRFDRFTGRFDW